MIYVVVPSVRIGLPQTPSLADLKACADPYQNHRIGYYACCGRDVLSVGTPLRGNGTGLGWDWVIGVYGNSDVAFP